MFQRLQKNLNLDFLDNKIAEEQAKQQSQSRGSSPAQRSSSTRRGATRTDGAAAARAGGKSRPGDARTGAASKGPDPEDFVIGDDSSDISRATTPRPAAKEGAGGPAGENEKTEKGEERASEAGKGKDKAEPEGLPQDVKQKLAKLEMLTARYQDLLRNYRTAHAHVAAIEPFEATLREHTPLTSISDPAALVEFLNQRSLQSDMVMEELKRVTGEQKEAVKERDELRKKLDEAEKKAKDAFDEAAGLRKERDESKSAASAKPKDDNDAFFSYEEEVSRVEDEEKEHGARIEQLEHDVAGQKEVIDKLSAENATLHKDLETGRQDMEAAQSDVRAKETQIEDLRSELTAAKTHLDDANKKQAQLTIQVGEQDEKVVDLQKRLTTADAELKQQQAAHAESLKKTAASQEQDHRIETLQSLVDTLKEQVNSAETSKSAAESRVNELESNVTRLEAEVSSSGSIIAQLRTHEAAADSLREQLASAEQARVDAQELAKTSTGEELAIASLRSQLTLVEKERNVAYQMIIDSGKFSVAAKGSEVKSVDDHAATLRSRSNSDISVASARLSDTNADASVQATPASEGAGLLAPPDAKKKGKKKKKSKAKKKTSESDAVNDISVPSGAAASTKLTVSSDPTTLEDLIRDPSRSQELLQQSHAKFGGSPIYPLWIKLVESVKELSESRQVEHDNIVKNHQATIEARAQAVRSKDQEIATLRKSMTEGGANAAQLAEKTRQVEALRKEIDALNEEMSDKENEIAKLQGRLQNESELREKIENLEEENEGLRESMVDVGKRGTDSVHELKQANEARDRLQTEYDQLKRTSDSYRDKLSDIEPRHDLLQAELKALQERSVPEDEIRNMRAQLEDSQRQKESLQAAKESCEKQIQELKAQQNASDEESNTKHKSLSTEMDTLRSKATELEQELAAANQLAQTRFRDLTDLRGLYNKIQPELKKLRDDAAEVKTMKTELDKANSTVKKLEGRERDLRSEISEYKSQSSSKDGELAALRDKAKKSEELRAAMEETCDKARKDLEKSESTRDEVVEARDKAQRELKRFESELKTSRVRLEELDKQVKKFSEEASRAREELQLKTAQQQSAQSLMDSMQDQTRELATQMKEVRERNESLEEELQDAHRLLSERSREGETMRRLLSEVEGRAEQRVKEMRERLDVAVEERDRAEDEASSIGRKKARELEDARAKLRSAEDQARRAADARAEGEQRERDFHARQAALEARATQARDELAEVRAAMTQLRDTLDDGERQTRALEREKAELRRTLDERDARLERLQKSSRTMAEELRSLQAASKGRAAAAGGSVQSSRSSMESARVTSPVAKGSSNGTAKQSSAKDGVDYVYLKNVLLQFLETREKKHQMQLVPVLGMLLHFDRQDEQKWMAAISTTR